MFVLTGLLYCSCRSFVTLSYFKITVTHCNLWAFSKYTVYYGCDTVKQDQQIFFFNFCTRGIIFCDQSSFIGFSISYIYISNSYHQKIIINTMLCERSYNLVDVFNRNQTGKLKQNF